MRYVHNIELECLRHLRELKADGNKISTLDGLQRMDGLVKLSLQANKIKEIDLTQYRWCVNSSLFCLVSVWRSLGEQKGCSPGASSFCVARNAEH
jgi:hypothetical protein